MEANLTDWHMAGWYFTIEVGLEHVVSINGKGLECERREEIRRAPFRDAVMCAISGVEKGGERTKP